MAALFLDEKLAGKVLESWNGYGLEGLKSMWVIYEPFADTRFLDEIRSATARLDQFKPGPDRNKAYLDFLQRFWELHAGAHLLDAGVKLDVINGTKGGPDLLANVGGLRTWIECVAVGGGTGADAVEDLTGSGLRYVQEDKIKLRFLGGLKAKRDQYKEHVAKGIVDAKDAYIIALNGRGIPESFIDYDPPRILRTLMGAGTLAVKFNLDEGGASEPFLQPKKKVAKASGAQVSSSAFLDGSAPEVSAVLYSDEDAWNRRPTPIVCIQNPTARVPLPKGWFPGCPTFKIAQQSDGTVLATRNN